ncbi:MAG: AAA family ATPase [Deltaproteobacteria bacterium]|nr:AAA family ATPase [Deltaproteobacteria bacterium]
MEKKIPDLLPGFRVKSLLLETEHFSFYAASDLGESRPVILRKTKASFFKKAGTKRIHQEYDLLYSLKIHGLLSPLRIETTDSGSIMVCRNFSGRLMADVIRRVHPADEKKGEADRLYGDPVSTMLMFGIAAAEILGHLHRNGIIHGEISPEVMVWDPVDRALTFVGLFSAHNRMSGKDGDEKPRVSRSAFFCMPPEQKAGFPDFRSDLYCLGAVFYAILTGCPPFDPADISDAIQPALNRLPVPPNEIKRQIPPVLSDIVMKLMAISPEDRYQSTFGLLNDLKKVFNQVRYEGKVNDFRIGDGDIPEALTIPPILYGREKEVQTLLAALDRVEKGSLEIVFISGPSGIGKSRIVEEIIFPVRRKKGFFISGRFDRLRQGVPYAPLTDAGKSIARRLLAEEGGRVAEWSKKLKHALGPNLALLIDAIPEISLITGNAPPITGLSPSERELRFNLAIYKFIGVLAETSGLLVIFLDDLQWMDPASIRLIRTLVLEYPIPHIMLIGTVRPFADSEPMMLAGITAALKTAGLDPVIIDVPPMSQDHTRRMIADTLFLPTGQVKKFAGVVHKSTGGNPLHVIQTIKSLCEEGFIRFDGRWVLEADALSAGRRTGGLMALMTDRMEKLPPDVSDILQAASFIGSGIDSGFLARVCRMDNEDMQSLLAKAEKEGFVVAVDGGMQFAHDRIRDAFYEMADGERRVGIHYRIGRMLLSGRDIQNVGPYFFEIVYHLNIAESIITSREERIELAHLNLKAGQQAKASSAYEAARKYMEKGLKLLGNEAWSAEYNLSLLFHGELCELSYLTGDPDAADIHCQQVLTHAKTPADRVRVLEVKIVMYTSGNRPVEAMAIGVEALGSLGLRLPKRPGTAHILWTLLRTKIALFRMSVDDLAGLDELIDPEKLAVSRVLMRCTEPAYVGNPNYLVLIILNMIIHTVKNGNSRHAIFAYAAYGALLGAALGDYKKGREFEYLALKLLEKYGADEFKAKIYMLIGGGIHHWTRPMREGLKLLHDSYLAGIESGDHSFASYGITCYMYTLFFLGTPLETVIKEFESFLPGLEKIHQQNSEQEFLLWFDLVSRLAGKKDNVMDKAGKAAIVEKWREAKDLNRLCIYEIGRMISAYLTGRVGDALDAGARAEKMLEAVMGQVFVSQYCFYQSLALVAAAFRGGVRISRKDKKRLRGCMKKMKKWSELAPVNYRHQYLLVSAGVAVVQNDASQAAIFFDSAVKTASENGFIHDEAMIAELAGLFWLGVDDAETGHTYLSRAFRSYLKWGAGPKALQMKRAYPFLMAS